MNKLMGMLAFARVVEDKGFTRAAIRLNLSVSAVTKAIARLERELGTQLLIRTTRKVALSDSGHEYYERCKRILGEIEEAEGIIKRDQGTPCGRVRLAMPLSFGRVTFLPRLCEFYKRYPKIKLDLTFGDTLNPLLETGSELAVHVGELKDSSLVARQLNHGKRVCVASPQYLKRHGTPKTPQDLINHNCIVHYPGPIWKFHGKSPIKIKVDGNLVVNTGDHLREAVLLDLGIGQSNWWTFRHDLATGRLVSVLNKYSAKGRPINIVFQKTPHMSPRLRVTIDFLIEITHASEEDASMRKVERKTEVR